MPAEEQVATKGKGASPDEEFIEFASRSLEDLFLSHVSQVLNGRNSTPQQPAPPISSVPIKNPTTASPSNTTQEQNLPGNHLRPKRQASILSSSSVPDMAPENSNNNSQQPAARTDNAGGQPFYEQQRKKLQALLKKRAELEQKLSQQEEEIYDKETAYLENTPAGNVMTGFDNYTKGTTQAAAAQRRKTGPLEQHRVFSRSSISYNPNAVSDNATTPGSSHAPTPVSSSFGVGSNHPTPTSAGGNRSATGGASGAGGAAAVASKDRKKKGIAGADAGDSESDAKEMKKVRTNFGATRK